MPVEMVASYDHNFITMDKRILSDRICPSLVVIKCNKDIKNHMKYEIQSSHRFLQSFRCLLIFIQQPETWDDPPSLEA